jgi:benzoylformate decarboxylase
VRQEIDKQHLKNSMETEKRGAEILLEILRSEGTRFIFGNPGTTELPLIDALIVNPDIHYVWGLQEATVVGMADGYAQASGKPAFVNLHTSGGLGHGMGAIMNAKIARVPMVITAGQQDLRHILPLILSGGVRFPPLPRESRRS